MAHDTVEFDPMVIQGIQLRSPAKQDSAWGKEWRIGVAKNGDTTCESYPADRPDKAELAEPGMIPSKILSLVGRTS